jgi:hypothetical protein
MCQFWDSVSRDWFTELATFFATQGFVDRAFHETQDGLKLLKGSKVVDLRARPRRKRDFFAFSRSAFWMVKTRTDGEKDSSSTRIAATSSRKRHTRTRWLGASRGR